uniref:Signal recognition particle 9 kDa protein isoform X1 n=1 Tax=Phascolarctos cinereus TaxID=38626 RepID=A0A6P5JYN8_PHACI|nr:signal recognition particle 9 kDa protein isoform X1 [Phascolarctos cinereus]
MPQYQTWEEFSRAAEKLYLADPMKLLEFENQNEPECAQQRTRSSSGDTQIPGPELPTLPRPRTPVQCPPISPSSSGEASPTDARKCSTSASSTAVRCW